MDSHLEHPDQYFYRTWQAFYANLGALRLFSEQVAKMSDQLDRDKIREAARELADILDDDPQDVEDDLLRYLPSLDETDVYPNFLEDPDVRKTLTGLQDDNFKARLLNWATQNPHKSHKLTAFLQEYLAQPPANGVLLRRSALIMLLSLLDTLFENLFFGYFYFQQLDRASSKNTREQQARKKAQKANRSPKGWAGRIENFQKLGVDITPLQPYMDEFTEITQRRNLLVHKDGVIDDAYLRHTSPDYQPSEAQPGRMLLVPTQYLQRAFYIVTVIGFWLTQASWRRWNPRKRLERAHRSAHNTIYNELRRGNYELVIELAQLMEKCRFPKKHMRYKHYILVNQAIALRELNRSPDLQHVLQRLSKTKREITIDIALAVLKEDFQQARRLLLRAKRERVLTQISPYWPLFSPISGEAWFQNMFAAPDIGQLPPPRSK